MDSVFGIRGKDFVIIVAETTINHSVFKLRTQFDKTIDLSKSCVAVFAGDHADRSNFGSFMKRNIDYSRFKNGIDLTVNETANFMRTKLAEALRKQPYQVHTLIGGVDKDGPQLFWIDYMGTLTEVPYGAHGYSAYFVSSVFSNFWKPDLDKAAALKLVELAIKELKARFIIAQDNFVVKIIDTNGISVVKLENK